MKKSPQASVAGQRAPGLAEQLVLNQAAYLKEAKAIYLQQTEQSERTYLLGVGATMLFLGTDGLTSLQPTFYALAWLVPAALSMFAFLKVRSIRNSLRDIADFEARHLEPEFEAICVGWEGYLESSGGRGRGAHITIMGRAFWLLLAAANALLCVYQLAAGPIFAVSTG